MANIPPFDNQVLQRVCDVLGDTQTGLTGSEIGKHLRELCVNDPHPSMTKRHRLFEALAARQRTDRCGNYVVAFIHAVMNPVLFTENPAHFDSKRDELNEVLSFAGLSLGNDGKLQKCETAKTLTEAEQRAGRLRNELQRREVHPDVLRFCRAELIQRNYFHAVFEATKSVADKIRQLTGLSGDGATLVDDAFGYNNSSLPYLAFNSLRSETEKSEHRGIMHMMKGMFGIFRNVTAHVPKIQWEIQERDAMDLLTIASFLHRRLDDAVPTGRR
jgi:uncharacterized protein (TIGR02391 family)